MVALNTGRLTQHSLVSIQHLKELRFIRVQPMPSISARARRLQIFAAARRSPPICHCSCSPLRGPAPSPTRTAARWAATSATPRLRQTRRPRCWPMARASHSSAQRERARCLTPNFISAIRRPCCGLMSCAQRQRAARLLGLSAVHPQGGHAQCAGHLQDCAGGACQARWRPHRGHPARRCVAHRSPLRCSAAAKLRCWASLLDAKDIDATVRAGRAALASETHTIDDIRSTAKYRSAVAGNLLEEFLRSLAS
jgi:hypothetical protein